MPQMIEVKNGKFSITWEIIEPQATRTAVRKGLYSDYWEEYLKSFKKPVNAYTRMISQIMWRHLSAIDVHLHWEKKVIPFFRDHSDLPTLGKKSGYNIYEVKWPLPDTISNYSQDTFEHITVTHISGAEAIFKIKYRKFIRKLRDGLLDVLGEPDEIERVNTDEQLFEWFIKTLTYMCFELHPLMPALDINTRIIHNELLNINQGICLDYNTVGCELIAIDLPPKQFFANEFTMKR